MLQIYAQLKRLGKYLAKKWAARWQSHADTLVQSRTNLKLAVFQPMSGDGTFGSSRWATWEYGPCGRLQVRHYSTGSLTHEEHRRLCNLHATHFFWWVKVEGGAFMVARAYTNGVEGQILPHPARVSTLTTADSAPKTDSERGGGSV